ncbi:hypothetical protein RCL1_008640 [Eukaryota sp. TZLM3-RCL]
MSLDVILSNKLSDALGNRLCDFTFIVGNQQVKCHRDLVAFNCKYIDDRTPAVVDLTNVPEISIELLSMVVDFFYSNDLILTKKNCSALLQLALFLQIKDLEDQCKRKLEEDESVTNDDTDDNVIIGVQNPFPGLFLNNSCSFHSIIYRDAEVRISSFILASFFNFFHEKWTIACPDSKDEFTNFTDIFHFSTTEFLRFWSNLIGQSFNVVDESFYCYYHLSVYLQFHELKDFLWKQLPKQNPPKWIERALIMANDHGDLQFIQKICEYLDTFPNYEVTGSLFVSDEVFLCMASSIKHSKLLIKLVKSVDRSYKRLHSVTPHMLLKILYALHLENVDTVKLIEVLDPLLNCKELKNDIVTFQGSRLISRLTRDYLEVKDLHGTALNRLKVLEIKTYREQIESIFKDNSSETVFYNYSTTLLTKNKNRIMNASTIDDQVTYVAHPLDGQVTFLVLIDVQDSAIGFRDPSTNEITGIEFTKRQRYSQRVDSVRIGDNYFNLLSTQRDCKVIVSFNFSTTLRVCFQIPSQSVYCAIDVPVNSLLCVRLRGTMSSCSIL